MTSSCPPRWRTRNSRRKRLLRLLIDARGIGGDGSSELSRLRRRSKSRGARPGSLGSVVHVDHRNADGSVSPRCAETAPASSPPICVAKAWRQRTGFAIATRAGARPCVSRARIRRRSPTPRLTDPMAAERDGFDARPRRRRRPSLPLRGPGQPHPSWRSRDRRPGGHRSDPASPWCAPPRHGDQRGVGPPARPGPHRHAGPRARRGGPGPAAPVRPRPPSRRSLGQPAPGHPTWTVDVPGGRLRVRLRPTSASSWPVPLRWSRTEPSPSPWQKHLPAREFTIARNGKPVAVLSSPSARRRRLQDHEVRDARRSRARGSPLWLPRRAHGIPRSASIHRARESDPRLRYRRGMPCRPVPASATRSAAGRFKAALPIRIGDWTRSGRSAGPVHFRGGVMRESRCKTQAFCIAPREVGDRSLTSMAWTRAVWRELAIEMAIANSAAADVEVATRWRAGNSPSSTAVPLSRPPGKKMPGAVSMTTVVLSEFDRDLLALVRWSGAEAVVLPGHPRTVARSRRLHAVVKPAECGDGTATRRYGAGAQAAPENVPVPKRVGTACAGK